MSEEYNKLVRDKIPEIIKEDGEVPITEKVSGEAYRTVLREKLNEEVDEYQSSHEVEELADILEVVYALGQIEGQGPSELRKIREEKRAERGGFEEGIVLRQIRE